MGYKLSKVDVWAGDLLNRPGMLARVLEALANAGASLEFVVARRVTENTSRVFVAPLKTAAQKKAAAEIGLSKAAGMHTLRVEGPDKAALGASMTRAIADAGINLRGVSAAAHARKSITYLAFAKAEELAAATKVVKKALAKRR